ncbi:MAG: lysozyme [Streptomyces sp.]|nr:lysozyme [Streptomyces sp.]
MHLAKWAASASALTLATAGAVFALAPSGNAATTGTYTVAPYVDMSNSQEGLLDTAITGHGLKAYTAAFVLGTGCNQIWGDTLPIGADSFTDPLIAKAKSEGASVIISSGGASGLPLAWTCSTQSAIDAGYQALINDYGVTQLDFDIEGAAIADTAAAARQMQAMKDLKASNPNLQFSVTLPVLTSGLTNDGVNILKAAKTAGVKIDVVNIMTMDFYAGTGTEMGQGSVSAAQATLAQMKSVDSGYTYANLGITPMIGKNDDGSTFTLADAQTVETFAAQNGVGRLAFWSVNRDQPCSGSANSLSTCSQISQSSLAFTDTFMKYAGGSGTTTGGTTTGGTTTGGTTTGGTTTGGTTTTGGSTGGTTCTTASWSSTQVYTGGNTVSWKGHNWKAKWWTQGEEPGTTGEWGVWQDLGAC